jgi:hypothetical protein
MRRAGNESPPVAGTTEGACIRVEANAMPKYATDGRADKSFSSPSAGRELAQYTRARIGPVNTRGREQAGVIFERVHRGHRWRLEVAAHAGRTFANWRKWYQADGEWKPTREGCTFPLEALWELTASLMAYHGLEAPDGPENGF